MYIVKTPNGATSFFNNKNAKIKDKIINIKATIKNIYDKKIFFKDKAKDIPKEKLKAMYKI